MLTLVPAPSTQHTKRKFPEKPLADRDFLVYKVLSFDGTSGESYRRVSFAQAASGLVAFGATGSGKTACFMLPALKALAMNGCPGLVLDVKGDYVLHLSKICPDRTVVIGPSQQARPVNLIAGISLEVFTTLMEGMRMNNNSNTSSSSDSYWGSAAVEDANLVFVAVRHYEKRAPTLNDIAEALSQPVVFSQKLKHWMEQDGEIPDDVRRVHMRRVTDKFSLVNFTEAKGTANDTVREQYTWHVNHLLPSLLPFADNEAVRETLCAIDAPNWADMIYGENKIIAFDMPSALFGNVAFTASKIVRSLVMMAILSDPRKFDAGSGFGIEKFSFILVDEYQEYVSTSGQRGLVNDNTFFDRSRSFHHINVVATQGVSSLIAQVGTPGTNAVLQNLRTKLFLPTDDVETLQRAETVASKSYVTMPGFLSNPSRPFSGFLYAPLSDSTFLGSGPVVTGEAGSTFPHMAIDKTLEGRVRVFEKYTPSLSVPLVDVAQSIDEKAGYVLHVLTTERSRSLADFVQAIGDARQIHGSDLDAWAGVLTKPVVTLVEVQATPLEWLRAMQKIEEEAVASDEKVLLAVVRGNSVVDSDLLAFKDPSVVKWVKRVRTEGRVLPMFGIANAQDDFAVHREAFLTGATPQGLGYRLGYVLSKTARTEIPQAFSPEGTDSRTEACGSLAAALNALYFSPAAFSEEVKAEPAVPVKRIDALGVVSEGETTNERHHFKKEWKRIGVGLAKIEQQFGASPAMADQAIAEFMAQTNVQFPTQPMPARSAAEVEEMMHEFMDYFSPSPRKSRLDHDLMKGPMEIPSAEETTIATPEKNDEDVEKPGVEKSVPLVHDNGFELLLPQLLSRIGETLTDAVQRLGVINTVLKTFGDSFWNEQTKTMLSKVVQRVDWLTPLSTLSSPEEISKEDIENTMQRLLNVANRVHQFGHAWGQAETMAMLEMAAAIHNDLDPKSKELHLFGTKDFEARYGMACLEILALKAQMAEAPNVEVSTEQSVLAPVLSNVAMFCANLLHQRQMSVVLSDEQYQAPANWSFLTPGAELLMASRFPLLKDICMARTRDVLEIEGMDAATIKMVIAWLDQHKLLHGLIDEEGLAKLDLFLVEDGPKKDDHAWELPHLLTGSYHVAKLFLNQVDERRRSILISENDGGSMATNFHSVVGCAE